MNIVESIIEKFISIGQEIYQFVFGDVDFGVLFYWVPDDIFATAMQFILILFMIALIKMIRNFLPF